MLQVYISMMTKKKTRKRSAKTERAIALGEWSKKVRERDRFKCAMCGRTECRLQAHHILPKKYWPEHMYDLSNGICLCPRCHAFCKTSAHQSGIYFAIWLSKNRSEQYADILKLIQLSLGGDAL